MTHIKACPVLLSRPVMVAVSSLAMMAAAAAAEAPAAAPFAMPSRAESAAALPSGEGVLKHLPAGRAELTFRGEMASRRFAVVLGRNEVTRITTFQVGLRNTVSLLPEHSAVTIAVNGRTLAVLPATAADKLAVLPVAVPPGLLVPGANTVQVTSSLTHRVDCSVPATFELWATLDPAQTGFLLPSGGAEAITAVSDLAAAPLAEDGTTRIHLRMSENADEAEVGQAARAVEALVRRAKLVRPAVEVGAGPGSGAGFDLVVDGHLPADVSPLAKAGAFGVAHDAATGRLIVEVDPDADEGGRATPAARMVPDAAEPPRDGFRKTFAQLGRSTEVFTGRRYEATIPVVLPSDFMSTNDRARVRLDGGHAATLIDGDGLALRVNGTLVSFVPFMAGKAERFDHREVELPLRFFHPGRNEVTLEGTLSAEADAQCRTATMPREARLTIADTSELEFPGFAHLTTIPQIPAAMATRGSLPVYLPGADPASIGAGLTVLANMAAEGPTASPQLHLGTTDVGAPGLMVAAVDQLPPSLSDALQTMTQPMAPPPAADPQPAYATSGDAGAVADTQSQDAPAPAAALPPARSWRIGAAVEAVQAALRSRGFFFGKDDGERLTLKSDDLLVAAVAPGGGTPRTAFDVMPRFTGNAAHWLVVTAANPATLGTGVRQLAASGRWDALRGEATRFDPAAGTLDVRQPRNVTYVMTADVSPSDMRPILGGLMSDNIVMSLVVLFVVLGGLGLSTHAVVRRMGVK